MPDWGFRAERCFPALLPVWRCRGSRAARAAPTPAIGDKAWQTLAERITGGVMRPPIRGFGC